MKDSINKYLSKIYKSKDDNRLYDAINYSLLAPGKRFRPTLFLSTIKMLKGNWKNFIPFACAIEMIHTYSLIHDDLPCMDDDDLRRGRPTNHKVFGEWMALLAGDALLTDAFTVASKIKSKYLPQAISSLSQAAGSTGMVLGQVLDLTSSDKFNNYDKNLLYKIHLNKTGRLIASCLEIPAILLQKDKKTVRYLRHLGEKLGLAFQIKDDLLSVTGTQELTGKSNKTETETLTFPKLFGIDQSNKLLNKTKNDCLKTIKYLQKRRYKTDELSSLIDLVIERNN